jgi:hypothetical protein
MMVLGAQRKLFNLQLGVLILLCLGMIVFLVVLGGGQ